MKIKISFKVMAAIKSIQLLPPGQHTTAGHTSLSPTVLPKQYQLTCCVFLSDVLAAHIDVTVSSMINFVTESSLVIVSLKTSLVEPFSSLQF